MCPVGTRLAGAPRDIYWLVFCFKGASFGHHYVKESSEEMLTFLSWKRPGLLCIGCQGPWRANPLDAFRPVLGIQLKHMLPGLFLCPFDEHDALADGRAILYAV